MLKRMKYLTALILGGLITATYAATCYVDSSNNCIWKGKTQSYSYSCSGGSDTATLITEWEYSNGNTAVVATSPGSTYWTRRIWDMSSCMGLWYYFDCYGQQQPVWAASPYWRTFGEQNCTYP